MKKLLIGIALLFASSPPTQAEVSTVAGKVSPVFSGDIVLQPNADVTVTGPTGFISSQGSITASGFFGDGAGLTNVSGTDAARVLKAGDTMTGQLTLSGSTLTLTGDAFSVGRTTLTIVGGRVGIGRTPGGAAPASGFSLDVSSLVRSVATAPSFAGLLATQYGATQGITPVVSFRAAGGTEANPTAVTTNTTLGFFGSRGHTGVDFSPSARVEIRFSAAETWTPESNATNMSLFITTTGALASVPAIFINERKNVHVGGGLTGVGATLKVEQSIWDDFALLVSSNNNVGMVAVTKAGDVGIGTTAPTEKLHVVGNSTVTGTGFVGSTLTANDSLSVGTFVDIATSPAAPAHREGRLFWDSADKTLALYNEDPDVSLQIGQESWIRVRNNTGSTILNGKPVYISGALGNRPTIALAKGDSDVTAIVAGLATHDIENNTDGYVTTMGLARMLDTSAFNEGDELHLSTTTAGDFRVGHLIGPGFDVLVGRVVKSNPGSGIIFVKAQLHQTIGIGSANQVRAMNGAGSEEAFKTLSGTTNRVTVSHSDTAITLSAPQDLHSGGSPTFGGMTINGNFVGSGSVTASAFFGDGSALTSVSGTDSTKVAKAGDTLTGSLNFSGVASDFTSATNEHLALMPAGTGNVGIGTTVPARKLSVQTSAGYNSEFTDGTQKAIIFTGTDFSSIGSVLSQFRLFSNEDASGAFGITINGGNVGIGTTNPSTKLHISSSTIKIDATGAPATGGALCLNAAQQMSKCTSVVDVSGNCTCP